MRSVWKINFTDTAIKSLSKLDKKITNKIFSWLDERIHACDNPRLWGKPLKGNKFGESWCYRIGDYRILCNIQDKKLIVAVI